MVSLLRADSPGPGRPRGVGGRGGEGVRGFVVSGGASSEVCSYGMLCTANGVAGCLSALAIQ